MKKLDANDPRLTAYALGELKADEALHVEAAVRADASLAAQVQQIQQAASMLRSGFASEPAPLLTQVQRQTIQQPPQPVARTLVFRGRAVWLSAGLAAAACLTLALYLTFSNSTGQFAHHQNKNEKVATLGQAGQEFAANEAADEQLRLRDLKDQVNDSVAANKETFFLGAGGGAGGGATAPVPQAPERSTVMRLESTTPAEGTPGIAPIVNPPPMSTAAPPPPGARSIRDQSGAAPANEPASHSVADASAPTGNREAGRTIRTDESGLDEELEGDARVRGGLKVFADDAAGENYARIVENPFLKPTEPPFFSTFSVDVDTASYSNVRRFLTEGRLPPKDAVRVEELINYFPYRYEQPSGETPFSAAVEINQAPWNPDHRLVRIGLKGKEVKADMRPPTSLVFLIDVSGSMRDENKLPLVKESMKLLVSALNADDRLAIVTYAGNAGLVMDSAYCTPEKKPEIARMIDSLTAGGSTNGAGGIHVAYDVATQHFIKDGVNRVMLCTDGDFNVGASTEADLIHLIEEKRATGVYLSVLGFGSGNLQDAKMKQLSKHGNGNYAFVDSIDEGKRALVDHLSGTLVPIAKDVKIQVEFNPAKVGAYRLIGYEQRIMAAQDFNDDRKDAGEIGAGHTVTALYEIIPPGEAATVATAPAVDELTFQRKMNDEWKVVPSDDMLIVKLRYKPIGAVEEDQSIRLEYPIKDSGAKLEQASNDFRFAAAVASFGMILRESEYKGSFDLPQVLDLAQSAVDEFRLESGDEFLNLVQRARSLMDAATGDRKD